MSVPQESLSDIVSGKEPSEPTGEVEKVETTESAPPAEVKADEKPRGEDGKFKKAEESAKADPKAEPAKPRADVAAIIDERRKRQAIQKELDELRSGKPAAKPSVLEDEDRAFSTRIDEGTRPLREQNYKLSTKVARLQYGDAYGEAEEAFAQAAEGDERLIAGLRASDDPGEYIYTVGLQIKELADVGGDFVKYRQKITADSRTQLAERDTRIKALEGQLAELTQKMTDLEQLPRSLNSKSSGAAPKAGSADPEDLRSIARFNNQSR